MMGGEHPYLAAVIRSLPLNQDAEDGPARCGQTREAERALAERLLQFCNELLAGAILGWYCTYAIFPPAARVSRDLGLSKTDAQW